MTRPKYMREDIRIELPSVYDRIQGSYDPNIALGIAVIKRALIDALDNVDYPFAGMPSRQWFREDNPALCFWCDAAGRDPEWVARRANARIEEYDRADINTRRKIRGICDSTDRLDESWEPLRPDDDSRERCARRYREKKAQSSQ